MNENKVKRRFGDRYEGRRIRGYNPMDRVAWYIMPRRNGATNLLAYSVDVASWRTTFVRNAQRGWTASV